MVRPWNEWTGGPCPVAADTRVDLIVIEAWNGTPFHETRETILDCQAIAAPNDNACWLWTIPGECLGGEWIIKWRLAGEGTDEAEARRKAERMAGFRKIAERAPLELPHIEPLPVPERLPEKAKGFDNRLDLIGKITDVGPAFIFSSPEELARAQGFSDGLFITPPWKGYGPALSRKNQARNALARARARRKAGGQ